VTLEVPARRETGLCPDGDVGNVVLRNARDVARQSALVLAYFMHSWQQISYIAIGFLIACGLVYLRFYLISRSVHYTITTQRIKLERGLLSKIQETLELFRIDHFEVRKPIGMRLLGQASLHLFSSDAELERFSIYVIPDLEELANTLRECQLRERSRRGLTTFVRA
jgi:membrane protein YdbS with pleckstrin-like domain